MLEMFFTGANMIAADASILADAGAAVLLHIGVVP
jgi:hypothetical protein